MTTENSKYPAIRFVDVFPLKTEEGEMFGLRDPSGIATETMLLSPDIFYLLRFFDGQHSQKDIRLEYNRAFGTFLNDDQLAEILRKLDAHLFLDGENFVKKRAALEKEFLAKPIREAAHAGQSYEAEAAKLKKQLRGFFADPEGGGLAKSNSKARTVKGLIAPHIDIRAGGPCYSHAYKALQAANDVDCFIILGTGHSGLANLYSILAKDFETPLGRATCDLGFVEAFNSAYGVDAYEVLPHKREHTIEFQLLFLQYLLQGKRDFTFVPILCSFSYHMLEDARFAREKDIVEQFSAALKKTIAEFHKKVCVIASVDLSHVGLQYGDEKSPDADFLDKVEKADKELLAKIAKMDIDGFYKSIREKQDRYRVCGFSPIYTLLKAIDAKEGKKFNYSSTKMDKQNSTVTFASMAFY